MNNLRLSFWFMRDNHTFARIEGKSIEEIKESALTLAKENPYGMICPVIVLNDDKEIRRVGPYCHIDKDGNASPDITEWANTIMEDDIIKSHLTKI